MRWWPCNRPEPRSRCLAVDCGRGTPLRRVSTGWRYPRRWKTVLATLETLNRNMAILRIPPLPLPGGLDHHPAICSKRKGKPRPKQLLSKGFTRSGNSTGVWDVE